MMTVDEMNKAKDRLHYTNEMISQKSGVPLPTVQKVLSGKTQKPRYNTLTALEKAFRSEGRYNYSVQDNGYGNSAVNEPLAAYDYRSADPVMEDSEYIRGGITEYTEDGRPIHPKYRIPVKKQGEYTTDDIDRIPDDIRVELIDGVIYDMASPTSIHQVIIGTVHTIMNNYSIQHGRGCMPYMAPLDVKFDNSSKTRVQPDLLVICEREYGEDAAGVEVQAPDFIMEVLSPSTAKVDNLIKLNKYFHAGVREYWIADPRKEIVTVYDFEHNELNVRYTFDDEVPVAISGGDLKIDFRLVKESLNAAERIEKSFPWELLQR